MDQYPVAGGHSSQPVQSVVGSQVGQRNRRGLFKAERRRLGRDVAGIDGHVTAEAAWGKCQHGVADRQVVDTGADGCDPAGAFETERDVLLAADADRLLVRLQHAERPQAIAEVQARGMHGDLHLARPRRPALAGLDDQVVQHAVFGQTQLEGRVFGDLQGSRPPLAALYQARHVASRIA